MLEKYFKPYKKWFITAGLILISIGCIGFYISTTTSNPKNDQTTENIEYKHCDEIMLFYPDGNYEYIYLEYDNKTIQYDKTGYIVRYLVNDPSGIGGKYIACISDSLLYFKEPKDYYNDNTTYTIFSGTFYVDNLK